MIVVKLLGGLGNQMFQYAIGRSLALRHGTQLKLNLTQLLDRRPRENFVFRGYDLDIFSLDVQFTDRRESGGFVYPWSSLPRRLLHRCRRLVSPYKYITERRLAFDPAFDRFEHDCFLEGSWASERYFCDYESVIRSDFRFRLPLSQREQELADKIHSSPNSVCVNFRRTDFTSAGFEQPLEYHNRAVKLIESKISKPEYYVFSDDVAWCQEHFRPNSSEPVFVTHDYKGQKFSSYLQLMCSCSHFIIPNSTFAWWAAWLNEKKDKIVIAPDDWANSNSVIDESLEMSDLIPARWLRV